MTVEICCKQLLEAVLLKLIQLEPQSLSYTIGSGYVDGSKLELKLNYCPFCSKCIEPVFEDMVDR